GKADDSRTANGDQRNVANGGERFDATAALHAVGGDFRAGLFGSEAVANPHGNPGSGGRAQGIGVQNLRTEVGELGGFVVGACRNGAGFGDKPRVRGFYAVDVGPDDGLLGVQRGPQDGGRIVRTPAAQGGLDAVRGGGDEAGDDGDDPIVEQRAKARFGLDASGGHQRLGAPVVRVAGK